MDTNAILEQSGIPLLLFVICMYYAWRLLALKDVESIRGKNKPPVKDPENYAKGAGKLIVFFGLSTLAMAVLVLFSVQIAFVQIVICTLILGVLWKRMNDRYE